MIKVIVAVLLSGFLACASTTPKLIGDHVCHRQENYTETVNSTTSEPIQVRKNFWCLEKIRCSELLLETKEIVQIENVTKARTIDFCCPNYEESELDGKKFCKPICREKCVNGYCESPGKCECEIGFTGATCEQKCPKHKFGKMCHKFCICGDKDCHPQTGKCLNTDEKIELSTSTTTTTTLKPIEESTLKAFELLTNSSQTLTTTEHNPYSNYSGEYGKEFDHYVKMGLNESDVQESIDKIVEIEIKKANEDFRHQAEVQDVDGYIFLDISENEIHDLEPLKHPQYVSDHHSVAQHEENIAMVTVGCLILGMLIFLLAMVYIRRVTRRVPSSRDIEADMQMPQKQHIFGPTKIHHTPLPILPLRPSLRKNKSVSFDESVDEVDGKNRKRTMSLTDAYDIPRKQASMMDLYAQCVKITPKDVATFSNSQKPFNTFPRKNVSRKQSLEHIYDEIPIGITKPNAEKTDKAEELHVTESTYENQESIDKIKM